MFGKRPFRFINCCYKAVLLLELKLFIILNILLIQDHGNWLVWHCHASFQYWFDITHVRRVHFHN